MGWRTVDFGKHGGLTLPQIAFADPNWFFWAIRENVFASGPLARQANEIARKARRIRIPRDRSQTKVVRYHSDRLSGRLTRLDVISAEQSSYGCQTPAEDLPHFDLSYAWRHDSFDKNGSSLIIAAVRRRAFKDITRLTKSMIERFFENDDILDDLA